MRLSVTLVALICVILAVSGSDDVVKSNVSSEKISKVVQNPKVEVVNKVEKLKVEVISDKVSELDEETEVDEDENLNEEKFDDVIQIPSSSSSPAETVVVSKEEEKFGKLDLDPAIQNSHYDPNYSWGKFFQIIII